MDTCTVSPDKGMYLPGDSVKLRVNSAEPGQYAVAMTITHLNEKLHSVVNSDWKCVSPDSSWTVEWTPPPTVGCGYGVAVTIRDQKGVLICETSTAFDVLTSWTDFPRYGFVTDFTPDRGGIGETLDQLVRFHVNGLQFYDWQFRHDDLVAPTSTFEDPLNRILSLETIENLIEAGAKRSIAAMAYVAVYAASIEYGRNNPETRLYDPDGEPEIFMDNFLAIMDPTPRSAWTEHLLGECDKALSSLNFNGMHVDQYGEPRVGWDCDGNAVDLPSAFKSFVEELKHRHPQRPAVFNAVKNWPIDELTASPVDFVYIELWPDMPTYQDIASVVRSAHLDSGGKPVVMALYLLADRPVNIGVANAIIVSNGGSRIEMGENSRLLSDPYFPLHEPMDVALFESIREYTDFRVRYADLLGPASAVSDRSVRLREDVWSTVRSSEGWTTISLVNMSGIEDARWDESHNAPTPIDDLVMHVDVPASTQVWYASADADGKMRPLPSATKEGVLTIKLPSIEVWTIVAIQTESKNQHEGDSN